MKARILALALALAAIGAIVWLVHGGGGVPDAPRPIAWDREVCAHCHMHVGEPRSAAQLVTDDGDVLVFDDAGCALRYIAEHQPAIHRLWFHGAGEDEWIAVGDVGFVAAPETPMASGYVAVARSTPGALTFDQLAATLGLATPALPGDLMVSMGDAR